MGAYRILITASKRIIDPVARQRAEMLSGLLIARQFLVLGMLGLVVFDFPNYTPTSILIAVNVANVVGYVLSRTKFYKVGAYLVLLEPMFGIPNYMVTHPESIVGQVGDPINLILAPVISSLSLSVKETLLILFLTGLTFVYLFDNIRPEFTSTLAMVAFGVFAMSAFALFGSFVNERYQALLATERAKVVQSAKLASIGEMAAGIAHELNSPLAAIVLNVDAAKEILSDQSALSSANRNLSAEMLADAGLASERMSSIIKGLKSFGRDSVHEHSVSIKLSTIVQDALRLCEQSLKLSGIEMRVDFATLEFEASVKRLQLTQTVLHLLNNAAEAVKTSDHKWIVVRARQTGKSVFLSVIDSGPGIDPAVAERMFEPFFTTKEYGRGDGLGLSISKGIAQDHGGDLNYNSNSPNTEFVIQIANEPLRLRNAA